MRERSKHIGVIFRIRAERFRATCGLCGCLAGVGCFSVRGQRLRGIGSFWSRIFGFGVGSAGTVTVASCSIFLFFISCGGTVQPDCSIS